GPLGVGACGDGRVPRDLRAGLIEVQQDASGALVRILEVPGSGPGALDVHGRGRHLRGRRRADAAACENDEDTDEEWCRVSHRAAPVSGSPPAKLALIWAESAGRLGSRGPAHTCTAGTRSRIAADHSRRTDGEPIPGSPCRPAGTARKE